MKGRITLNKLTDWINEEFIRHEFEEYVCIDVQRTRLRGQDYERGAARLIIRFDYKDIAKRTIHSWGTFFCFYSIYELQNEIKKGKQLSLIYNDKGYFTFKLMTDLELALK